ncbi:hypothetical protein LguiB_009151 [Lonicera macranthoides]
MTSNITTRSRSNHHCSESDRFTFPEVVNAPHFFKFIHPLVLQDGRLRIPKKFIGKYGEDLSDHVFLKVPNGNLWKVELEKSSGEVWLKNGWKEFAEHYSVDFWNFLVFRYGGNSHFHVIIFDMSASEIEYPLPPPPTTTQNERNNVTVDLLDGGSSGSILAAKRKQMASEAEKERALQSAKAFTSKNPFFMVIVRPSYVNAKSGVNIPQVFATRYFTKENENDNKVTLQVADGMRVWSVTCILGTNYARLSRGWVFFARDNCLQEGDVCVFEVINKVKNLCNVVIFRAVEAVNC